LARHIRFDQLAYAMQGGTAPPNVVTRIAAITLPIAFTSFQVR